MNVGSVEGFGACFSTVSVEKVSVEKLVALFSACDKICPVKFRIKPDINLPLLLAYGAKQEQTRGKEPRNVCTIMNSFLSSRQIWTKRL